MNQSVSLLQVDFEEPLEKDPTEAQALKVGSKVQGTVGYGLLFLLFSFWNFFLFGFLFMLGLCVAV